MGFRLFVSHSTPLPERSRLVAVVEAIKAAGEGQIEVMYDQEQIAGGDSWRQRIAFMLHACHAAVILLDENARESDWVLTEALFLSLRSQIDPRFQLIPVSLLPPEESTADALDVKSARAQERARFGEGTWRVVDLARLQQARGANPAEVGRLIVDALRAKGSLVPHRSPIDTLALQVSAYFTGFPDPLLDAVIDEIGWSGGAAYVQPDRSQQLAMAITGSLTSAGLLSAIRAALDLCLGPALDVGRRLAVLDAVAPLPLDPSAASLLLRPKQRATGFVHVNVQTAYAARVVDWYIRRAHLAGRPRIMPINNADAGFETLREELRETWRRHNRHLGEVADEDVDADLRTTTRYVTLPGPLDAEVLGQLEAAFPAISFVMFGAHEFAQPLPPNVVELMPRMNAQQEEAIVRDYFAAIGN